MIPVILQTSSRPSGYAKHPGCAREPTIVSEANESSRNLLFGIFALQNGLIDQGQLLAAFQSWTHDKSRSMADHLDLARGSQCRLTSRPWNFW